ncbi:MAG: hypothetical protein IJ786_04670 [Bacteroidaceae bacterium]|nr:hypothetical protein [Bacteroidaceae bacterium]
MKQYTKPTLTFSAVTTQPLLANSDTKNMKIGDDGSTTGQQWTRGYQWLEGDEN